MFSSVRARLTLWYTGVLALVLVTFAFATYTFLARMIRQRMDDSLAEAANAFAIMFTAEHQEEEHSSDEAAIEVVRQFRFRDHHFIVYGDGRRLVAAAARAAGVSVLGAVHRQPAGGDGSGTVSEHPGLDAG